MVEFLKMTHSTDNEPIQSDSKKNIKKNYYLVVQYGMKSYICNRKKG